MPRLAVDRLVLHVVSLGLLAGLVLLSAQGLLFAVAAAAAAGLVAALVVLGPERLGTLLMVLAMFTAPQNSVRPIPSADILTFSDVFVALAAGLLLPVMLARRSRYPAGWLVGSVVVTVMVLVASLFAPDPLLSFFYGLRLPAALLALPLIFLAWRPSRRVIDVMAWAYVLGHCVSTVYAFYEGRALNNRYDGLTTHFNFFGISAVVATALLLHLYHRTSTSRRWLVWGAGLVVLVSVIMSGSRAAALVVLMMGLLYPLLERSIASAYLLVVGAFAMVLTADRLLVRFGSGSVFERLSGDATTSYSDSLRTTALDTGFAKFELHPFIGNGFDLQALDAHNIYLEVAIGVGVLGLIGHVMVLVTAIVPLVGRGELRRLAYVAFGYAAVGMLTNSLWDRFVWMGISLSLLAAAEGRRPPDDEPSPEEPVALGTARRTRQPIASAP